MGAECTMGADTVVYLGYLCVAVAALGALVGLVATVLSIRRSVLRERQVRRTLLPQVRTLVDGMTVEDQQALREVFTAGLLWEVLDHDPGSTLDTYHQV